jgi:flavin-dependent dehydrogenase
MQMNEAYDVAIIGGGLAGLAASIQLAKSGHSVILFEKEKFPFHKVCGEYISLESRNFLNDFGLALNDMNLPIIDTLFLTSPNGKTFQTKLPLGGFGISRFKLDASLADFAKQYGVHLCEETKIDDVTFDEHFHLGLRSKKVIAKICCAAYGKRSNLDIKWERKFLDDMDTRVDNYVAIKYHIQTNWPDNVIGLHNFESGYCGISKIEDDKYCLCYMTKAESLKRSHNNIQELEETVLYKNPHLKRIFLNSKKYNSFPITISQVSFSKKTQVENHVLMLGDSAGMITPLCGNGMSIALHTAKIASTLIHNFLEGKISRHQMEESYKQQWKNYFGTRLQTGRMLQHFFGSGSLSNFFVGTFKLLPFLSKPIIKMTHGKTF